MLPRQTRDLRSDVGLRRVPRWERPLRGEETDLAATAGIADALTVGAEGRPVVVVDWKSDVAPDPQTLDHYRGQVRAYLDMTGAEQGLIVLMTSATVISVSPSLQTMAA